MKYGGWPMDLGDFEYASDMAVFRPGAKKVDHLPPVYFQDIPMKDRDYRRLALDEEAFRKKYGNYTITSRMGK